jgi:hypothetical protein
MGAEGTISKRCNTRYGYCVKRKVRRKLLRKLADTGDALALEAHEYGF